MLNVYIYLLFIYYSNLSGKNYTKKLTPPLLRIEVYNLYPPISPHRRLLDRKDNTKE